MLKYLGLTFLTFLLIGVFFVIALDNKESVRRINKLEQIKAACEVYNDGCNTYYADGTHTLGLCDELAEPICINAYDEAQGNEDYWKYHQD